MQDRSMSFFYNRAAEWGVILAEETGNPQFCARMARTDSAEAKIGRTLLAQKSDLNKKRAIRLCACRVTIDAEGHRAVRTICGSETAGAKPVGSSL